MKWKNNLPWWQLFFFVGVFTATVVEKDWGYDSNKVVIDEVLGMSIALFMLPFSFWHFAGAFILFRFFDIVKPLFIRRAEKLNGGWGVMLDDALAGIYSSLTLQLLLIIF